MSSPNEMPFIVKYTLGDKTWQISCPSLPYAECVRDERIAFYGGTAIIVDALTGKPL